VVSLVASAAAANYGKLCALLMARIMAEHTQAQVALKRKLKITRLLGVLDPFTRQLNID
jgi:hypothetical protein